MTESIEATNRRLIKFGVILSLVSAPVLASEGKFSYDSILDYNNSVVGVAKSWDQGEDYIRDREYRDRFRGYTTPLEKKVEAFESGHVLPIVRKVALSSDTRGLEQALRIVIDVYPEYPAMLKTREKFENYDEGFNNLNREFAERRTTHILGISFPWEGRGLLGIASGIFLFFGVTFTGVGFVGRLFERKQQKTPHSDTP